MQVCRLDYRSPKTPNLTGINRLPAVVSGVHACHMIIVCMATIFSIRIIIIQVMGVNITSSTLKGMIH